MDEQEKLVSVEDVSTDLVLPECPCAATCGQCYWNDGGWCKKHGGYVDLDKWACSSYSPA